MPQTLESPLQSATSGQRILVVAEDPALRDKLAQAVRAGGGQPVAVAGVAEIPGPQVPYRLVIAGWDGRLDWLRAVCRRLRDSAQLVAMVPQRTLSEQVQILADVHCNHVLTADERGMWLLQVTVSKFVTGELFGIERYLPSGTPIMLTRLRDFQGRQNAIDEVLSFADKSGVRRQVRASIGQVCEELLMNALYDAPVDASGTPLFHHVDVKERVDKLSPRPVSIRYAVADDSFAVSVRDRFGRLEKSTILRYIEKCLRSSDQIDRKTYGAGLGLYLIVNAATQYVVNVAPGMATEVVCTFDRGTRQPLRALSMFVYPGNPTAKE
jgi:hypothetical protein